MILLVEDDPDIREEVAEALREEGYRVVTAANGEEGYERAKAAADDLRLILLDLMMPVMDGWDCRKRLMKDPKLANVPVLIFSGAGSVHEEKELLKAAGVVIKPFRLRDLLESITKFCGPPGA